MVGKIDGALGFAQQVVDSGALYFKANPAVAEAAMVTGVARRAVNLPKSRVFEPAVSAETPMASSSPGEATVCTSLPLISRAPVVESVTWASFLLQRFRYPFPAALSL